MSTVDMLGGNRGLASGCSLLMTMIMMYTKSTLYSTICDHSDRHVSHNHYCRIYLAHPETSVMEACWVSNSGCITVVFAKFVFCLQAKDCVSMSWVKKRGPPTTKSTSASQFWWHRRQFSLCHDIVFIHSPRHPRQPSVATHPNSCLSGPPTSPPRTAIVSSPFVTTLFPLILFVIQLSQASQLTHNNSPSSLMSFHFPQILLNNKTRVLCTPPWLTFLPWHR